MNLRTLFFLSQSSRKSSAGFKQGFDKSLADLSVTGNYGQGHAGGRTSFRPRLGRTTRTAQWPPCVQAEKQGLPNSGH